jgi:hypothetical protein
MASTHFIFYAFLWLQVNKVIEYFVVTSSDDDQPLLFDLRRASVDGTHGILFYSLQDIEQRPNAHFKHEVCLNFMQQPHSFLT